MKEMTHIQKLALPDFERRLGPCVKCEAPAAPQAAVGFAYMNSLCCPHCSAPYFNYRDGPAKRPGELFVVTHIDPPQEYKPTQEELVAQMRAGEDEEDELRNAAGELDAAKVSSLLANGVDPNAVLLKGPRPGFFPLAICTATAFWLRAWRTTMPSHTSGAV